VAFALPLMTRMDENEHPKGALVFMLLYLLTLSALWLNAYMRLWGVAR
jgi:hypothetical protein